ncbi:hypothetical protein C5E44_14505 [Nocardia nova]|nr:hypothetical protein C5E44_14505 [Nocardia nova]
MAELLSVGAFEGVGAFEDMDGGSPRNSSARPESVRPCTDHVAGWATMRGSVGLARFSSRMPQLSPTHCGA